LLAGATIIGVSGAPALAAPRGGLHSHMRSHATHAEHNAGAAPSAAAPQAPVDTSEVVARIGSVNITANRVRMLVASLSPREQIAVIHDPALLSQAVRLMIANQIAFSEAVARKWDQVPAVAQHLQQVRNSAITDTYLQYVSMPPQNFPSDDDVAKVYDANKTAFLVPRQFRIAQIFVVTAKTADPAATKNAVDKLANIEAALKKPGADFAALATAQSEDAQTAAHGGEIGWVPEGQLKPEIKNEVEGLPVNSVSDPIKMDDGWHIIKLLDTKAAYTRPLAEVRPALVQRIRAENAEARRRAYLGKLLEQNPPALDEIGLSKIFKNLNQAASK
jgi:peptidylprolyl isomerase